MGFWVLGFRFYILRIRIPSESPREKQIYKTEEYFGVKVCRLPVRDRGFIAQSRISNTMLQVWLGALGGTGLGSSQFVVYSADQHGVVRFSIIRRLGLQWPQEFMVWSYTGRG